MSQTHYVTVTRCQRDRGKLSGEPNRSPIFFLNPKMGFFLLPIYFPFLIPNTPFPRYRLRLINLIKNESSWKNLWYENDTENLYREHVFKCIVSHERSLQIEIGKWQMATRKWLIEVIEGLYLWFSPVFERTFSNQSSVDDLRNVEWISSKGLQN